MVKVGGNLPEPRPIRTHTPTLIGLSLRETEDSSLECWRPFMKRIRVCAIAFLLAAIFLSCGPESDILAASVPTISNATVMSQSTSLTLPTGGVVYIYAFATDGSSRSTGFVNALSVLYPPSTIANANGNAVAGFAFTTSNTNSYSTSTKSYTVAGFSVSGFGPLPGNYYRPMTANGISAAPGTNGVSVYAVVPGPPHFPAAGYLVVIVAIGGDEQCMAVSAPKLPGFTIDASNSGSGSPAIIIGHAYPVSAGGYVVTMASSQCTAGQNPNNAADFIEAFEFLPTTTT